MIKDYTIAYFVEADDKLISPWFIVTGKYESHLTRYFLGILKPGLNCIDVGSNFGYYTCLMGKFCPGGRIITVEADRHVYEIVRDNIGINGFAHASAVHAAIGARDEEMTLFRRKFRSGNTSIVDVSVDFTDLMGETRAEPFTVRGTRMDTLAEKLDYRVDLVKIDVEGAEPLVFQGAEQMIRRNRQLKIVMEWSPSQIRAAGFDLSDFLALLGNLGLRPYDISAANAVKMSFDELMNVPYQAGVLLQRD